VYTGILKCFCDEK
jgi:hypothetical protein